jgi:hypothetical protein
MTQMARSAVDEESGYLGRHRYVLHDRDTKFCADFRKTLATGGVKCLRLPPRSANLNAFAERWVRSVKTECPSHLILVGEGSLRRAMKNFCEHYHEERNHQGKNNVLLFPAPAPLEPGRRRRARPAAGYARTRARQARSGAARSPKAPPESPGPVFLPWFRARAERAGRASVPW